MDPRPAATRVPDPDAVDFIRFCYRRRRVGWPELYDEMCAVASRGLYHGMCADDLATKGIGFGLYEMPALAALARQVVDEEAALRRPVAVLIRAEASDPELTSPTTEADPEVLDVVAHAASIQPVEAAPAARHEAARPEPAVRFAPLPAGA
jgi:hypothetical protein